MIDAPHGEGPDYDLACRHRPKLMLDASEPYPPIAMGYSILREIGPSPSSKFIVTPKSDFCIEYAIWYDWDIGHLYDLEHVWVHVSDDGTVLQVEASFHGQRIAMNLAGGLPAIEDERPILFVEPGKHAHWADGVAMAAFASPKLQELCGTKAGIEAVHRGNSFFQSGTYQTSALSDRLARRKMQRDAFVPKFSFTRCSDQLDVALAPWPDLECWIPERVNALIAALPDQVPHLRAIFLDCGDTLISEATEIKIPETEVVTEAEEIPHAMDAVRDLHSLGYPLALVADGPRQSFENLLKPRGIWDLLQAHVISGDVGVLKPDPRMFDGAMRALGLDKQDKSNVVMVGNNLERDIKGANEFGLLSLFVSWSTRRSHIPQTASEMPFARIGQLSQLVHAIEAIELALPEVCP